MSHLCLHRKWAEIHDYIPGAYQTDSSRPIWDVYNGLHLYYHHKLPHGTWISAQWRFIRDNWPVLSDLVLLGGLATALDCRSAASPFFNIRNWYGSWIFRFFLSTHHLPSAVARLTVYPTRKRNFPDIQYLLYILQLSP